MRQETEQNDNLGLIFDFWKNGKRTERYNAIRGNDSRRVFDYSTRQAQASSDLCDIRAFTEKLPNEHRGDSWLSERELCKKISLILINTAKENGLFINPDTFSTFGERLRKLSGESWVYKSGDTFTKVKDPFAKRVIKGTHAEDIIYEHIIHNFLFPNTRYTFKGISEDFDGIRLILTQKEVRSYGHPTDKQIAQYLTKRLNLKKDDRYSWGNDYFAVTDVDATSDNVLLGEDGELYFIDPIIKLKKSAKEILDYLMNTPQCLGSTIDETNLYEKTTHNEMCYHQCGLFPDKLSEKITYTGNHLFSIGKSEEVYNKLLMRLQILPKWGRWYVDQNREVCFSTMGDAIDVLDAEVNEDLLPVVDRYKPIEKAHKDFMDAFYSEARKRNISLYDFVAKDKLRPIICGVHHDAVGKYAVATDSHLLYASKAEYNPKLAGKTIDKNGYQKGDNFPNWYSVVPPIEDSRPIYFNRKDLLKHTQHVLKQCKLFGIATNFAPVCLLATDSGEDLYIGLKADYLEKFLLMIGDTKGTFYVNKEYPSLRAMLFVGDNDDKALIIPTKLDDYHAQQVYYKENNRGYTYSLDYNVFIETAFPITFTPPKNAEPTTAKPQTTAPQNPLNIEIGDKVTYRPSHAICDKKKKHTGEVVDLRPNACLVKGRSTTHFSDGKVYVNLDQIISVQKQTKQSDDNLEFARAKAVAAIAILELMKLKNSNANGGYTTVSTKGGRNTVIAEVGHETIYY